MATFTIFPSSLSPSRHPGNAHPELSVTGHQGEGGNAWRVRPQPGPPNWVTVSPITGSGISQIYIGWGGNAGDTRSGVVRFELVDNPTVYYADLSITQLGGYVDLVSTFPTGDETFNPAAFTCPVTWNSDLPSNTEISVELLYYSFGSYAVKYDFTPNVGTPNGGTYGINNVDLNIYGDLIEGDNYYIRLTANSGESDISPGFNLIEPPPPVSDYGVVIRNQSDEIIIDGNHMNFALGESGTFVNAHGTDFQEYHGGHNGEWTTSPTIPDPQPTLVYSVTYENNYEFAPLVAVELMQSRGTYNDRGGSIEYAQGPISFYGHTKDANGYYSGFQFAKTQLTHDFGIKFNYMVFVPADSLTPDAGEQYGLLVKNPQGKVCYDSRVEYLKIHDIVTFEIDDLPWNAGQWGGGACWVSGTDSELHAENGRYFNESTWDGYDLPEGIDDSWEGANGYPWVTESASWVNTTHSSGYTTYAYTAGCLHNWELKTWRTHASCERPFYIINNTTVASFGTYFAVDSLYSGGPGVCDCNWLQNSLYKCDGDLNMSSGSSFSGEHWYHRGQPTAPKETHVGICWASVINHSPRGTQSANSGGHCMQHPLDVVVIDGSNYYSIPDYEEFS